MSEILLFCHLRLYLFVYYTLLLDKITKEEFATFNTEAINEYMKALRESHPRFRDRFSDQTWLRQDSSADTILRRLRTR